MAQASAIEWTEATWNPVTGCSKVSPGCAHCYAETLTARFAGRPGYIAEHRPWTPENAAHNVRLHPERLEQPLRWRRPRLVFVNSMSDLFHEQVSYDFVAQVFAVMSLASQHTFQVLTKRPERARAILGRESFAWDVDDFRAAAAGDFTWPLPNVWLGASIENARHVYRADVLREIPAAVRFISAEPLLGSLLDSSWPGRKARVPLNLSGIDWLIVGGESGPDARPMHPEWARELRDACLTSHEAHDGSDVARTAFFFKQWGAWAPSDQCGVRNVRVSSHRFQYESRRFAPDGTLYDPRKPDLYAYEGMESLLRVGKKAAGRELDGRTWDEMPPVRA